LKNARKENPIKNAILPLVHVLPLFSMCYGENGRVKFVATLANNVFRHKYSMMQS
jgi:hypothetical protein